MIQEQGLNKKAKKPGRRCRVCGKLGGAAFTRMLRRFGYPDGDFAHPGCMARVQRERKLSREMQAPKSV